MRAAAPAPVAAPWPARAPRVGAGLVRPRAASRAATPRSAAGLRLGRQGHSVPRAPVAPAEAATRRPVAKATAAWRLSGPARWNVLPPRPETRAAVRIDATGVRPGVPPTHS